MALPAARVKRLNAEQRLDVKLRRDEFAAKVDMFLLRIDVDADVRAAAEASGIRVRTARQLLARPDHRARLAAAKVAVREGVTVAEVVATSEVAHDVEPIAAAPAPAPRRVHMAYPGDPPADLHLLDADAQQREHNRQVANAIWDAFRRQGTAAPPRRRYVLNLRRA